MTYAELGPSPPTPRGVHYGFGKRAEAAGGAGLWGTASVRRQCRQHVDQRAEETHGHLRAPARSEDKCACVVTTGVGLDRWGAKWVQPQGKVPTSGWDPLCGSMPGAKFIEMLGRTVPGSPQRPEGGSTSPKPAEKGAQQYTHSTPPTASLTHTHARTYTCATQVLGRPGTRGPFRRAAHACGWMHERVGGGVRHLPFVSANDDGADAMAMAWHVRSSSR